MGYNSKYKGEEVEALLDKANELVKEHFNIVVQSSNSIEAASTGTIYVIDMEQSGDVMVSSISEPEKAIGKYTFVFKGATSLTLPDNVMWVDGSIPEIDSAMQYELSILATRIGGNVSYKAVLSAFANVQ